MQSSLCVQNEICFQLTEIAACVLGNNVNSRCVAALMAFAGENISRRFLDNNAECGSSAFVLAAGLGAEMWVEDLHAVKTK